MPEKLRRYFEIPELRADPDTRKIQGHAAVFDTPAEIGGFMEQVARGAFADSIDADDIRALWNHNPDLVLGRNTAGTLRLKEDDVGLAIDVDAPDTQIGRDAVVTIGRGDVSQMSFGFYSLDEAWEKKDGVNWRTIKKAKLLDVSPVTYPAYAATDVSVRSLADQAGVELAALQRALVRSEHDLGLEPEDVTTVEAVVARLRKLLPPGTEGPGTTWTTYPTDGSVLWGPVFRVGAPIEIEITRDTAERSPPEFPADRWSELTAEQRAVTWADWMRQRMAEVS